MSKVAYVTGRAVARTITAPGMARGSPKPGYDPAELFLARGLGTPFRMARAVLRLVFGDRAQHVGASAGC